MDVQKSYINPGDSLPKSDQVYRVVLDSQRDRNDKFIPSTSCFSLSDEDKKDDHRLSVDWSAKTTPEESISRIGSTYKFNTEKFKAYKNREIFAMDIEFLNSIDSVIDVIYNPVLNAPPIRGKPNNLSHSLIVFSKEEYEKNEAFILMKLRDHAKKRKLTINMTIVDSLVNDYQKIERS